MKVTKVIFVVGVVGMVLLLMWLLTDIMIGQKSAYKQCHEDCVNNCTSLDAEYYKEVNRRSSYGTDCWCIRDKTPFSIGRMESTGTSIC